MWHKEKKFGGGRGFFPGLTREEPLIEESVETWEYGPAINSLYQEFRDFGRRLIDRRATETSFDDDEGIVIEESVFPRNQNTEASIEVMDQVWKVYGGFTAIQLSNLTHVQGSPWSKAREGGKRHIQDNAIQRFFIEQYELAGG